jgi:hypothetical protein
MSDGRDILYVVLFLGVGIWLFFWGFMRLRRKRKIENIPTSTVRGLAMGLVELIGKAKKRTRLISPLSAAECVFYRYTVERYRKRGRHSEWVTIAKGDSTAISFWLDDGTGRILVFPQGCESLMAVDYEFRTGLGKPLPSPLTHFMEQNGLSYKGLFGNHPLRFKEWFILEDETLYVLGTATTTGSDEYLRNYNQRLTERLEALKSDPKELSQVDLNKDGEISVEEWNAVVLRIEKELIEEQLNEPRLQERIETLIGKGANEVFIISDSSQKALLRRLSYEALGGVFGGAALSLIMLIYLLSRLNICSF